MSTLHQNLAEGGPVVSTGALTYNFELNLKVQFKLKTTSSVMALQLNLTKPFAVHHQKIYYR